jgi:hypothetical protein
MSANESLPAVIFISGRSLSPITAALEVPCECMITSPRRKLIYAPADEAGFFEQPAEIIKTAADRVKIYFFM